MDYDPADYLRELKGLIRPYRRNIDEDYRSLERKMASGDLEDEELERFRAVYDRTHGEGSFLRHQRELREAAYELERAEEQQQRDNITLELESYLNGLNGDPDFQEINDILEPLYENGDVNYYAGYAPGSGNDEEHVFVADWNHFNGLDRLLENLPGTEVDWEDMSSRCNGCNRLISAHPTHYGWTPAHAYLENEGDFCRGCLQEDPAPLFEQLAGSNQALSPGLEIDPEDHGWVRFAEGFETGHHAYQNDDPNTIAQNFRSFGFEGFLFVITSTGQFDTNWEVWISPEAALGWLENILNDMEYEDIETEVEAEEGLAVEFIQHLYGHPEDRVGWPGNINQLYGEHWE